MAPGVKKRPAPCELRNDRFTKYNPIAIFGFEKRDGHYYDDTYPYNIKGLAWDIIRRILWVDSGAECSVVVGRKIQIDCLSLTNP